MLNNQDNVLLIISGQIREFLNIKEHLAQNVIQLQKNLAGAKITILVNIWNESCSYFPTREVKSWIVDKEEFTSSKLQSELNIWVQRLKISGIIFNGYVQITDTCNMPRKDLQCVEKFDEVSWLNFTSGRKALDIEEITGEKFKAVIKIRPDIVWALSAPYQILSLINSLPTNAIAIAGGGLFGSNMHQLDEYYDGFEIMGRQAFITYALSYLSVITGTLGHLRPSLHVWLKKYLSANNVSFMSLPSTLKMSIARPKVLFEHFGLTVDESSAESLVDSYQQLDSFWMKFFKSTRNEEEINMIFELFDKHGIRYEKTRT